MVNTPPQSSAIAAPEVHPDDGVTNVGHDEDVNDMLAKLDPEQLASIVAAARASEGNANGESSGVDASSILAALPPSLGQAASALTSFASSLKTDNDGGAGAERGQAEQRDGDDAAAAVANDLDSTEPGEAQAVATEEGQQDGSKNDVGDETHDTYAGDETTGTIVDESTDDYRNEHATQAAIAAMESLAAQSGLHLQDGHGKGLGRSKRDTGPEAERMRKDQHKEVERKRREQISNGITELANIVPGCDTKGINKTAIINSAVRYIVELKDNEASNIEKWTLEKLLMDQAMGDLTSQLDGARKEISRLRAQLGLPDEPEEQAQPEQYVEGDDHGASNEAEEGTAAVEGEGDAQMHEADVQQNSDKSLDQAALDGQAAGDAANHADTASAEHGRTRDASELEGDDSGRSKRSRHA